ncbi:hypothetical protein [Shewanella dokdonensis]|uniref:Uncharacterized protein n=1 Tax=Shewanella dokdonensis TaxID=712036 RepID=A0ABX8DLE5_9GAMM|nr:hypothetical protein [Shewanella dokdonensis]MCL1075620.1 hypothetical protein [Shewanella dokdonensis]QVK24622.1 hypothetical protein KHX94_09500 [Shewanella dokdonensis]
MALTRKQWNNILIIASVVMVGLLTLLNKHTHDTPKETVPLFDEQAQLAQLQLAGVWMARDSKGEWQCDDKVLNCQPWVNSWLHIRVSALLDAPKLDAAAKPQELLLQLTDREAQIWLLFADSGLLKSAAGNWYQIPPSLRTSLQPLLNASVE